MKRVLLMALSAIPTLLFAQGGITSAMLRQFKADNAPTANTKVLRNALAQNNINDLALVADNPDANDTYFSNEVKSKGITNQRSSGRCWLFTGLNVMRADAINRFQMGSFQFSQSYNFFYDQLEKSNLFLQAVIDNAKQPIDNQLNTWLFEHPLSDGGTFSGVQDVVTKYGVVPADVFPESFNANNTSKMSELIQLRLREDGLELRKMVAKGAKAADIEKRKTQMLSTVYRILSICLGTPPEKFTWTLRTADGKAVETKTYTPQEFYQAFVGKDLKNSYVMVMNDPTHPYYKTYTIDMDRHTYDGKNWTYINLPMNEIKAMAIASIKDSAMMYMSCDVGKLYNRKSPVLSMNNYDYESLLGTKFTMDKADRIRTHASASSHAMTLMAVDLDANGKPKKWMVENSWGEDSGFRGHLIMTDEWFYNYLFRLVVDKKYVPAATLKLLDQKPTQLPAWDPLFKTEE